MADPAIEFQKTREVGKIIAATHLHEKPIVDKILVFDRMPPTNGLKIMIRYSDELWFCYIIRVP